MENVNRILSPVSVDEFFQQYWERQPLHISRDSAAVFAEVISKQALLDSLLSHQLFFPSVQLTQSGRSISPDTYTDANKKILPEKAAKLIAEGATLVWSQAHDHFDGLHALCRELQSQLKLPCLANVYLSPVSQQGFNAHYDSHDVMIVQVSGCKTFRFYTNGVTLPFNNERFDAKVHSAGELTEEIKLEPGDTLYIPRGMMHDAVASGEEDSLHITVGVYTATYKDLIQQQIEFMAQSNVSLRNSVDALTGAGNIPIDLPSGISLGEIDSVLTAQALDQLQDELALDALAAPALNQPSLVACDQLTDIQQLSVNHHSIMNAVRDGMSLKLRLFGKILHFDEPLSTAVEWVIGVNERAFTPQAIPFLTEEQRLAVCKQLITENVVLLVK